MSSPLHFKSNAVFAGINSTVPRFTWIFLAVCSIEPEPDITTAILGPFNAWNLYKGQLAGI